ncbi:MAG: signal recognition particle protein, partial [Actinoallomurus sp.]
MPGMGQMRGQLDEIDDRDLDRVGGIINSMTPDERRNPKMINGSRRARIAKGSGVSVTEVNNLVTRFFDAQKMMRQMAGGMGIPGMPGTRRKAVKSAGKKPKKGKQRSGDPRKRAQGAGAGKGGAPQPDGVPQGLPPGLGGGGTPGQLPPGFQMPDLSKLQNPKKGK